MAVEASTIITDYVVFLVFVISSTLYSIWDDNRTKKAATKDNYVFAKGRVSSFAVILSISRGQAGTQAFLGYASEMFYRGSGMWETLYGIMTAYVVVAFVFVPVFCSLEITSIYQYLQLRFQSRFIRGIASLTFIIRYLFAIGITIYIPTVVLHTVTGISYVALTCSILVLIIFFTLCGGIKAVITADVIQGLLMIFVSIGLIVQGVYDAGGVGEVIRINNDNDRLKFFHTTGDPTTRVDTISAWVGQLFMSISVLGCHQCIAQRYLSMKTVKQVQRVLLIICPLMIFLFSFPWLVGMVIYSAYYTCDPMESHYTKKIDELLPFYVEDKLSYIPGVLGLFMACLFNGSLCAGGANINSLATVTWEDFLYQIPAFKNAADRKQLIAIKALGVMYCVITAGFVAAVAMMAGIVECGNLTTSATAGPLAGVFILAILIPFANAKGAISGMLAAHAVTFTLLIGSRIYKLEPVDLLPTSVEGCTNTSFSPWIHQNELSWIDQVSHMESNYEHHEAVQVERTLPEQIFNITYMYYGVMGTFITVIVGVIVSLLTLSEEDAYDHKLLHPLVLKIWRYFGEPEGLSDEPTHNQARRPTYTFENTEPRLSIIELHNQKLQIPQLKLEPIQGTPRLSTISRNA